MSRVIRSSIATVALGLAAVASVTFASAADKPTAKAAATDPTAYNAGRGSGPNVSGTGFTTVLARSLPKGHFVMWAKVEVSTQVATYSRCDLRVGGLDVDTSQMASGQSPTRLGAITTHSLQTAAYITGNPLKRIVRLQCLADTAWSAVEAKLTAMPVNSG